MEERHSGPNHEESIGLSCVSCHAQKNSKFLHVRDVNVQGRCEDNEVNRSQ